MGDEQDPPIVLGRPFLNTTRAIIYIKTGKNHFQFRAIIYIKSCKTQRRTILIVKTKLTDVKNIEEIKEKSAQLLLAQYSEVVTLEKSPPNKQVWRKKDQSM
jgi:hypothetical protein